MKLTTLIPPEFLWGEKRKKALQKMKPYLRELSHQQSYVGISKTYYDFWILEINANLAGLIKIMKVLVMVEKQRFSKSL